MALFHCSTKPFDYGIFQKSKSTTQITKYITSVLISQEEYLRENYREITNLALDTTNQQFYEYLLNTLTENECYSMLLLQEKQLRCRGSNAGN